MTESQASLFVDLIRDEQRFEAQLVAGELTESVVDVLVGAGILKRL